MKKIFLGIIISFITFYASAQEVDGWKLFAVTDGVEVYIDTTSIERVDVKDQTSYRYKVVSKKLFIENIGGKAEYLDKVRSAFARTEKNSTKVDKKMKKWNDLSYTLIEYTYDCLSKTYRTNLITDYDSRGKVIVKTKTPKNAPWTKIAGDDIADLMMFYVCDYEQ